MQVNLDKLCVSQECPVRQAISKIDANEAGIVLVVSGDNELLGTITDGDVRRAILAAFDLSRPVKDILALKDGTQLANPITALADQDAGHYLGLMKKHRILHLPLLTPHNKIAGLVTMDDFVSDNVSPVRAVVMAGGFGSRLMPLTKTTPKPMLPVGGRPLMEIIIEQLRAAGVMHVNVTTHYKPEKIKEHFGNGNNFGVKIDYVNEDRPLGTAGALGLVATPKDTTLVMNGDILTSVDFRAMIAFHRENGADLTIAVRRHEVKVPYGVIENDGVRVKRIKEKPSWKMFVNAGIYLLEPSVYKLIPNGDSFDMTDLIEKLIENGFRVASFPIREDWMDIGKSDEYEKAQKYMEEMSSN
ncbi:nucleotidyltransferase family protein [Elusimicrobiota bacterium]